MSINVDTIAGPEGDSFKFNTLGDTAKGIVLHAEQIQRENQFNNNLEEVLRISLEQDNGETIIIWPVVNTNVREGGYASRMAKAIAAAVRAAGQTTLDNGGILAVRYERAIPTDRGNPAKGYVAEYHPPAVTTTADSGSGDDGAVTGLI